MRLVKSIILLSFLNCVFSRAEDFSIFMSADEPSAKFTAVAIESILRNAAQNDTFEFYIIDNGLSEDTKIKLQNLEFNGLCHVEFLAPIPENQSCYWPTYDRYTLMEIKKFLKKRIDTEYCSTYMEGLQKLLFFKYLEQTDFYTFKDWLKQRCVNIEYYFKFLFR